MSGDTFRELSQLSDDELRTIGYHLSESLNEEWSLDVYAKYNFVLQEIQKREREKNVQS